MLNKMKEAKIGAMVIPHVSKFFKSKDDKDIVQAMVDDDKFSLMVSELHKKLPDHIRKLVGFSQLMSVVSENRRKVVKTKKFKKKLMKYEEALAA